ncbi:MAG: YkoF family thiamine/hydroxymethylpyrimidine-binding protein [Candidatus Binataceae bacterium]
MIHVSARISVYPLRQEHLSPAIEAVEAQFKAHGLKSEVGAMSTQIVGDADTVFAALRSAFVRVAANGQVVMTFTVSNACPV